MQGELISFFISNAVKLMIIFGMFVILFTTKNHFPKHIRKYTIFLITLIFVNSIFASIDVYLTSQEASTFVVVFRRIASFICYSARPFIICFAIFILKAMPRKIKWYFTIPAFISMAFHSTSFYCRLVTYIDNDNIYHRGPLGTISFFVCGLYVIYLIYVIVKIMIEGKTKRGLVLIFIVLSCVIGATLDTIASDSSNYLGNVLCVSVLFYYLYLNIEYANQYEESIIKSKENELILSQVKPHFMYNVLTSIYYLCDKDSAKAKKAVYEFSYYLRNNLDTMRGGQFVDFLREIDYVKNYLSLEKIRFEEELEYDFALESVDFKIPKFTLQPLVENAVKHGVTQKEGGGHITIYSKEEANRYVVGVKDDGVGFDMNVKKDDGRSHVGLENISSRLIELLNEDIHIESKKNVGTHVYFYVPKESKEEKV